MSADLTLLPQADGLTYALGAPSSSLSDRSTSRFLTQFLSILNLVTLRGTVFMQALANGQVRTNADIVTLVATACAQVRSLQSKLAKDVVLGSTDLVAFEFLNLNSIKLTVRLNTTAGSSVNDIVVSA